MIQIELNPMAKPEYFVFNDEAVKNSYGFCINTAGIKMDRFNENPVMLNNHINTTENLVGKWFDPVKENGQLKLKPNFDEGSESGKDVAGKVERGFLKGCSMGIIPNWDSMERAGDFLMLMECELVEGTIIPVPSNKGSLAIYGIDGNLLSEQEVKQLTLGIESSINQKSNLNIHNMKKIILSVSALMALGFETQPEDGLDVNQVEAKILGLSTKNKDLKEKNDALELAAKAVNDAKEAADKLNATTMVDLGITQGKIAADKRDTFIQLGVTSPDVLKATLEAIPAKTNLGLGVIVPGATGTVEIKTMEDFQKLGIEAQLAFKKDNAEAYNTLVESI